MNTQSPHEHAVCGAKTRNGTPCQRKPTLGSKRCNLHGGKSLRGIASPTYQGKGYSKDMPTRLLDRYMAALDDPNMLSMSKEIAVVDARIGELLSQLDTGESGSMWKALRASVDGLEQARTDGAVARRLGDADALAKAEEALAQHLTDVTTQVKRGAAEYTRWRELYDAFERRRRLVETMRKQRRDMMNFVSTEQLILVMDRIANVVAQNVTDPKALARISQGITQIVNLADTSDGSA